MNENWSKLYFFKWIQCCFLSVLAVCFWKTLTLEELWPQIFSNKNDKNAARTTKTCLSFVALWFVFCIQCSDHWRGKFSFSRSIDNAIHILNDWWITWSNDYRMTDKLCVDIQLIGIFHINFLAFARCQCEALSTWSH